MRSLERAVIGRIVLTLIAVGLMAIVATYAVARYEANQFMDDYLRQFAIGTDPSTKPVFADPSGYQEPEDRFERVVWQSGTIVSSTKEAPAIASVPDGDGFKDLEVGGEAWRAFVTRRGDTVAMLMQRTSAREELALHAAFEVSLVILGTMIVVWLVTRWTVGRSMRRLNLLSNEIAARSVDARDPIPISTLPSEFTPLIEAMNALTARLQAALLQQRQFVADSAHELRTPLTALRIQIDNLSSASSTDVVAAADALRAGITRASRVLNQLLRLARFDGQRSLDSSEILQLGDVLKQCVADAIEIAEIAGIDVGITAIEDAPARMARHDLKLLLSNVIDNAVRYTPRGGVVDCELHRHGDGACIRIMDSGPGVPSDLLPRLTERFFRGASLDIEGSGLGLAIADAIAESHGLKLVIANRPDRSGLLVTISFPPLEPLESETANPQLALEDWSLSGERAGG